MRRHCAYENDAPIKIPNWYMSLPQGVLDKICDIAMEIERVKPKRTRQKPPCKTKFYLLEEDLQSK